MKFLFTASFVALLSLPSVSEARVSLQDDKTLENGLVTVAIARTLYRSCDDIEPKKLKAYGFLRGLYKHAKSLGYTTEEIEAYIDNEADKKRVESKAYSYIASKGADMEVVSTICEVGRAEIEVESFVGKYLRIN